MSCGTSKGECFTVCGLQGGRRRRYFVGTRRFSSSCQFSTTTIRDCECSPVATSPGFMIRKRSPSGAMSHCRPILAGRPIERRKVEHHGGSALDERSVQSRCEQTPPAAREMKNNCHSRHATTRASQRGRRLKSAIDRRPPAGTVVHKRLRRRGPLPPYTPTTAHSAKQPARLRSPAV